MNISFISSSISRSAGGLFVSVRRLAQQVTQRQVCRVAIHGLIDQFAAEDVAAWRPLEPQLHQRRWPHAVGYAPNLLAALQAEPLDICHSQGIWMWPSAAVHHWHTQTGKPYLISPRGMLDPWALSRSRFKKWIASRWFEAAHLRDASCLHALCQSEAKSMRQYGLKNPICVIPNGIDLPDLSESADDARPRSGGLSCGGSVKTLLFLGRLHPKKGLPAALKAWASISSAHSGSDQLQWQFAIAGWGQQGHAVELQRLCDQLGIRYRCVSAVDFLAGDEADDLAGAVVFLGPAYGEVKDALLRQASAFVLPSFSEGLPMAVLEAWAYCLPVLMTDHCNLAEGFAVEAAIRITTDDDSIAVGMNTLIKASDSQRTLWGENGRRLVETHFTWPNIASQMVEVYRWVSGDGPKPECVLVD